MTFLRNLLAWVACAALACSSATAQVAMTGCCDLTLGSSAPAGGGGSYGAEATALFLAMTSSPDSTRKGLIDTEIKCEITAGTWAKTARLSFQAAGNSHDGLLDWKDPSKSMSAVGAMTFVIDRGFHTTAVSQSNYLVYADALDTITQYGQDDAHFSVYFNAFALKSFGGLVTPALFNGSLGQNDGSNALMAAVNTNSQLLKTGADATPAHFIGMWLATRTGPNLTALYKGGAAINGASSWNDTSGSIGVPITAQKVLFGDNVGTAFDAPSTTTQVAMSSLGSGFSSTDFTNAYACRKAYLDAILAS